VKRAHCSSSVLSASRIQIVKVQRRVHLLDHQHADGCHPGVLGLAAIVLALCPDFYRHGQKRLTSTYIGQAQTMANRVPSRRHAEPTMLPTSRPVPFRRAPSYAAVGMLVLAMPEAKAGQEEGLSACEVGDWSTAARELAAEEATPPLSTKQFPLIPASMTVMSVRINDGDLGPAGFCTTPS